MSTSSAYFGVKDANNTFSFIEPQWLTPNEVANEFRKFSRSSSGDDSTSLIYPNELILSDDSSIIDVLLLAKYRHKNGNLKLKTVLLSQILNSASNSTGATASASKLLILKLPKDSYYWAKVDDAHLIPKYALRAGYDHSTKQFSYIGRMKASSLLQSSMPQVQGERRAHLQQPLSTSPTHRYQYRLPQQFSASSSTSSSSSLASTFKLKTVSNTITNLIGTLAHIYEYIPAMVLQLNDLSFLDDKKLIDLNERTAQPPAHLPSMLHTYHNHLPATQAGNNSHHHYYRHSNNNDSLWYKLKAANKNRQNLRELEFNFISNNYEVLCLKRLPATLKQMCISKLLSTDESGYRSENDRGMREQREHYEASCSLPNSIKSLLWPAYLLPGHCLVKNSKMRSSNGLYEINLNPQGAFKLIKFAASCSAAVFARKTATFEKNIESLLISHSGVFLVYDANQPNRRPNMLYKHHANRPTGSTSSSIFCSSRAADVVVDPSSTIPTHLKYVLDTSAFSNLLLELSDAGFLRVVIRNEELEEQLSELRRRPSYAVVNLIDLNEYFSSGHVFIAKMSSSSSISNVTSPPSKRHHDDQSASCGHSATLSTSIMATTSSASESSTAVDLSTSLRSSSSMRDESIFIKLKLMADLSYLRHLPGKIFGLVSTVFKSIANSIASRL